MAKNIFDVKECPDCAGTNLVYVESRDQVICKDCGLVYEPLAPESRTVVAVTQAIETKEKEIGTPLAIIPAPVIKKPKVAKKKVKKKVKKKIEKKEQKKPSRRPKKAVIEPAKAKKEPSRRPKKAVAKKPARFSFFKRLRRG